MSAQYLWLWSLVLGAIGMGLWALTYFWRLWRGARAAGRVEQVLSERAQMQEREPSASMFNAPGGLGGMFAASAPQPAEVPMPAARTGQSIWAERWLDGQLGQSLLPDEDRRLLDQAGYGNRTAGGWYVCSRLVLAVCLPIVGLLWSDGTGTEKLLVLFFGFALGLMLPKWFVKSRGTRRRARVSEELPLFVDMLRLLQGVGLSIDQSLHILASEFGSVLRVLSVELGLANQLYASGRSREQSFQRMANLSEDEDMKAVVNLLVQVDRFGGAVQEPLQQFGQRLREKRQAQFKESIGKITVKMTGVMVLTLLPALLVITAGPGFMAVIRSLSKMGGGA